jgi:hypothetical protein
MATYKLRLRSETGHSIQSVVVQENDTTKLTIAESVIIVTKTEPAKPLLGTEMVTQVDTLYPMHRVITIERAENRKAGPITVTKKDKL